MLTHKSDPSPLAYYIFNRPRVTIAQFSSAYQNYNFVLGGLFSSMEDLEIAVRCVEPSEARAKAARLLDEVQSATDAIHNEWCAMNNFWYEYDGILSRRLLTEDMVVSGRDRFDFWTDEQARRNTLLAMQDKVKEVIEMCKMHMRQRQIAARAWVA